MREDVGEYGGSPNCSQFQKEPFQQAQTKQNEIEPIPKLQFLQSPLDSLAHKRRIVSGTAELSLAVVQCRRSKPELSVIRNDAYR
jgi:hypothetical protein